MKLFIFRHGQTDGNAQRICQTDDYELNDLGRKQAEGLSFRLGRERLPLIYASPLPRACETGKIVASFNNAEVVKINDLREMSFGAAEGMFEKDLMRQYGSLYTDIMTKMSGTDWNQKFPGGESKNEVLYRFKQALDYIKKNCPYNKVGIATHGHLMRIFYYDRFGEDHVFENCEFFVLDI